VAPYTSYTLVLYTFIFIFMGMAYWMTLFNVPNYGGNIFVNGMICGLSESLSGVLSGILIAYTSTKRAFLVCCCFVVVFSTLNTFFTEPGSIACYATLFWAIFGVGGLYNCFFVMVNLNVPTEKVGRVSTIAIGLSNLTSTLCPFIVLLN
jgi:hypothetical protein